MASKNVSNDRVAPNNWMSLEEYEERRGLGRGRVTTADRGKTPRAWVNQKTLRVVYRESPFSSHLSLGEIDKSSYTIKRLVSVDFNFEMEPKQITDKAFEYMEHDNGMTEINKFFD